MNVAIDIRGIDGVTRNLGLYGKAVTTARARAIRDTLRTVRASVRRDAAAALKVPQRVLQSRLVTSKVSNTDDSGKLWAGTWDISPFAIGAPRSSIRSRVIQVGSRKYVGAFMKPIFSSEPNIWIRKNSKNYRADLYPPARNGSGGSSLPAELRHKFPVVKASIRIDETMARVFERDEERIREVFAKNLRRQINYALNIEGRR